MNKKNLILLFLPTTILLIFTLFIPLFSIILPGFSINNYVKFFLDPYHQVILMRTINISLITTIITIIFGLPTAFYISQLTGKMKTVLTILVLFPLLTNSVIRSYIWINILGKNGAINSLLLSLHIIKEPLSLLYTDFAIVVGLVYLFLPLMITTLQGVLEHIDNDILLASNTLGASQLQTFIKIVCPLSIPGLLIGAILVFTGSFTAYTTPQLLGGNTSLVMSTFINQKALVLGDWQGASIVSTIMIMITLLVTIAFNTISKKINKAGEVNENA